MPRAETHQLIQETALALFAEHGFDGVTVETIAEVAGVSHMTFFRYFPTKESVVLSDPYDPLIAAALSDQPGALPPIERVRRALVAVSEGIDESVDASTRARIRIGVSHPRLRAAMYENNHETETLLVSVLEGSGVDSLEARSAVGACMGALMAALVDWATHESPEPLGSRIERALGILEAA